MAGLVNIKTLSPLEKQGSKIKLSFGNYNLWGVAATTSQKLTDDFAFSINARYRQDDGYFKNEYTRQNSGSTRSGGGRGQLDWRGIGSWVSAVTTRVATNRDTHTPVMTKPWKRPAASVTTTKPRIVATYLRRVCRFNISTTDSSSHQRRVINSSTTICIWTKTLLPAPYLHYNKNKKCMRFHRNLPSNRTKANVGSG